MIQSIANKIKAGYSGLYLTTYEEARVEGDIVTVAKQLGFSLHAWSITRGVVDMKSGLLTDGTDEPLKALDHFESLKEKSILLMRDFHFFVGEPNPLLIRRVKEALLTGKNSNRVLIVLGCQLKLVPELEKEFTVIEVKLPDRKQLLEVAQTIADSAGITLNGNTEDVVDAMCGLTTLEASDAASLAAVESGRTELSPSVIAREKAATLKKNGILEVVNTDITFDDLGGLDELKAWTLRRVRAFTKAAADYHLPMPKGVCLYGVQGCGKSFATKAIANELKVPLLKLDAGKLFNSLVGQSEATVRAVIAQVEAFGKCVLQIEELDKSFAGMKSSHDGDSGTTRRVIGTFLTWMQEKTSPVFIVATANDLTKLPPELLRKGRWDELWFIDLPTESERIEIWKVQIRKKHRAPKEFDLGALAKITEGWSGAEIEALFGEALYAAFDENREPDTELLATLSRDTVPLSKMMAAEIEALRQWSMGKARRASKPQVVEMKPTSRKLIA